MLYIMRHGKTDWNAQRRIQGHTDIPLNEEGRQMAIEANKKYKDVHFDVCYCSPLVRARETAELFLEGRNVPITADPRLKEMSFGVFEGFSNVEDIPGCPIAVLFSDPERYNGVEGGETFEELFARTGAFLEEVALPLVNEGKDVLIVAHGAVNNSIIGRLKNRPLAEFWDDLMTNCQLAKLI